MALTYIPELPKEIHPFYSIWKNVEEDGKVILKLETGDVPSTYMPYQNAGIGYACKIVKAYKSVNGSQWEESKLDSPESYYPDWDYVHRYQCLYTNHDIISAWNNTTVEHKKSADATEIKISGGNNVTLKKGMLWNLGEAVSIAPKEAFQGATFESSNKAVCTIDEKGNLAAVGEGDCIITITSE